MNILLLKGYSHEHFFSVASWAQKSWVEEALIIMMCPPLTYAEMQCRGDLPCPPEHTCLNSVSAIGQITQEGKS